MEALSRSSSEVQLHLYQNGITDIDPESISFKVEGPTLNRHKKNIDFQIVDNTVSLSNFFQIDEEKGKAVAGSNHRQGGGRKSGGGGG